MAVPLLDLNRQNAALRAEFTAVFARILDSGKFILGAEVEEFEAEVARFLGVRHAIAVSSGTDALLVALLALDIGPGDEVICPSFTFFATAGSIARVGATPVFADVCVDSFNLDAADAAQRITARTKAIMPVHLFGQSADMEPILALAKRHDLAVIEDAAQALGARHKGRACGSWGDFGAFSFFPSKNLGGFGDGGMVVTGRDDLAEKVRLLRTHGAKPKYYHKLIGGNFRMDALQCALLRVKLPHLTSYSAARRQHAAEYAARLAEIRGITLPSISPHNDHIWNQYTVRLGAASRRNAFREHLTERGIGHEIYYPLPLHRQACFAGLPQTRLPVSEALAEEVLSVPVFPELTAGERSAVIAAIASFSDAASRV